MKPTYVLLSDDSDFDPYEGIEYGIYHLSLMDDNETEIKTYTSRNFEKMYRLGEKIASDRNIEFVNDAMLLN